MNLQVLVATMGQHDFSKIEEMNISTDCIIANQAGEVSYNELDFSFGKAKLITTNTLGLGINRNIAMSYSDKPYLLLADDDIRYVDDYEDIVETAFKKLPDADCIFFNVDSNADVQRKMNRRIKRIRSYSEALNYCTVRIAVKRSSILRENIWFSQICGSNQIFHSGEDSIFIADMMKHGLKLYVYPKTIAVVDDVKTSSWFTGYNKKYYYDKGAVFKILHKNFAKIRCLGFLILHPDYYKSAGITFTESYRQMKLGIKGLKDLIPFEDKNSSKKEI